MNQTTRTHSQRVTDDMDVKGWSSVKTKYESTPRNAIYDHCAQAHTKTYVLNPVYRFNNNNNNTRLAALVRDYLSEPVPER